MNRTTGRAAYRAVRDMLVRHRDDYDAAVAAFRWPDIGDRFMLIQANLGTKPPLLREAVGAGEPLNPEVIDHVQRHWGVTIRDGFGQNRDHGVDRQYSGFADEARFDGSATARCWGGDRRPGERAAPPARIILPAAGSAAGESYGRLSGRRWTQ